jgi:hypothetical protein
MYRRTLVKDVPGHIASAADWANRRHQRADSITGVGSISPEASPKQKFKKMQQPPSAESRTVKAKYLDAELNALAVHWV